MNAFFPYLKLYFQTISKELIILPSYKGSTLRGGFGNAFKRIVCAIKNKDCTDCLLKEKCVYSYIFETLPPADTKIMRKYTNAPHPFIIEPPPERKCDYTPEDEITFGLTIIGNAIEYLPYFIYTFEELGKIGIGKGRGKYDLRKVKSVNKIIYDSADKTIKTFKTDQLSLNYTALNTKGHQSLTLDFLTPTRINYDRHLTFELEFHILIRNLLRRLSLIYYFHCKGDPSDWDFNGIIEQAKNIKVKNRDLKWYDWERYSARQDTKMKMGGFTGSITFEGNIEPFLPLIKAGEVLHVGKGTSFGLGRYSVV